MGQSESGCLASHGMLLVDAAGAGSLLDLLCQNEGPARLIRKPKRDGLQGTGAWMSTGTWGRGTLNGWRSMQLARTISNLLRSAASRSEVLQK